MNLLSKRFVGLTITCAMLAISASAQSGHSLLTIPEQTKAEETIRLTPVRHALDRVSDAIVHVMVKINDSFRIQRDSSGVILSSKGLVLTNWHLVAESTRESNEVTFGLKVKTADGKEHAAKIVAKDEKLDLALLQMDLGGKTTKAAKLGGVPIPGETAIVGSRPGEGIYASFIGALTPSLSDIRVRGNVLSKSDIMLSDANTKVFADGSPVFDINGRVLAIVNTSNVKPPLHEKSSDEERHAYRTSFGFAVRISAARRAFANLLKDADATPESAEDTKRRTTGISGAVNRASHAIVSVRRSSLKLIPAADPLDPNGKFPNDKLGSGVIVHPSGLVLTNAETVGGGDVLVTTLSGKTYPGTLVEKSFDKNIAVVKLTLPTGTVLPHIELADSSTGMLGERVAALGNRYGNTVTVKIGVLSSKQRTADVGDQHKKSMGHFQTDATIHNGNTGGALINSAGELLGINDASAAIDELDMKARYQAIMALTDTTIGFAIPSNWIRDHLSKGLKASASSGTLVTAPSTSANARLSRESQITRIVEKHADCFLNVFVKRESQGAPQGGLMQELFPEPSDDKNFRLLGQGSGVIIDPSGLALTNWHVVNAATYKDGAARKNHKVFVSLGNGKKYEVEILSTSRVDDLALLQLKIAPGEKLAAIRLGDSDAIRVGDTAIAVGNPHGFANSVTVGLVSAKNRDIQIKGRARYFRGLLQTDAAINPGNSGGALIDLNGYLIGINSAGHQREAKQGFAIPVNYVRKKFHSTLLASDKLRSVFLGMECETRDDETSVKRVDEYGPAADAGVQVGDRLMKAQGIPVRDNIHFVKIARAAAPFEPFSLEVRRAGTDRKLALEPVSDAAWAIFRRAGFATKEVGWDVAARELKDAAIAAYREFTGDADGAPAEFLETGLIVTHVHPDAVAAGMDMKKGDVVVGIRRLIREIHLNDRYVLDNINSMKVMRDLIRNNATEDGSIVELWIVRNGKVIRSKVTAKKVKQQ